MKYLIIILMSFMFVGCISDGDRALRYAKDSYESKNCTVKEIERTDDFVVADVYCGTAYPKRLKFRRKSK